MIVIPSLRGVLGSSAAAGFDPSNLSNLLLWLKADAGVTYDGSNLVSVWADQSGNGNDATSLVGYEPIFQDAGTSAIGHDCIYFNAAGSYAFGLGDYDALTIPGAPFDSVTNCTIFVVSRQLVAGPYANGNVFGQTGGNNDCPYTARRKLQMTSGFMFLQGCDGDYNGGVDPNIGENVYSDFPFTLYGVRPDSASGEAKITTIFNSNWDRDNGGGPVPVNAGRYDYTGILNRGLIEAFGVPSEMDVIIGTAFGGGSENYKGEICEIVFYDRALTDTEFNQIIDYLNNKYSVYV